MNKIPLSDQVNRFVAWRNEQTKAPVDMTDKSAREMVDDLDSLVTKFLDTETTDATRDLMIDELCSANAQSLKFIIDKMLLHREDCFDNETTRKLQVANILASLFQLPLAKKLTRAESSSGLASIVKTLLVKPIRDAFDKLVEQGPGNKLNKIRLVKAMSLIDTNLVSSELFGVRVSEDCDENIRALTLFSQVDLTRNLTLLSSKRLKVFVTSILQMALRNNDDESSELLVKMSLHILGNLPQLEESPLLLSCLESIIYASGTAGYDAPTVKLALRALANMKWRNMASESLAEQLKARLQFYGSADEKAIRDYTILALSKIIGVDDYYDGAGLVNFALGLFNDEYLMSSSPEIANSSAMAIRVLANSHPVVMDKVKELLMAQFEYRDSPSFYSLVTSLLDQSQLERVCSETRKPALQTLALARHAALIENQEQDELSAPITVAKFEEELDKLLDCPKDRTQGVALLALMNDHQRLLEVLQDYHFRSQYHQIRTVLIAMGPRIVPDLLVKLEEFRQDYDTSPERIRLVTEILAAIVTKPALVLDRVHLQKSSQQIKELSFTKLVNLDDYDSLDWKMIVTSLVDLDSSRKDRELHKKVYRCLSLNKQFCRKHLIELCASENARHAQVAEKILYQMGYTRTYVST